MEVVEIYTDSAETSRQKSLDSSVPCDLCISTEDTNIAFWIIADYLCFKCKFYLCTECYTKGHAKHSYVCAAGEAEEREKKLEGFVDELLKETSKLRRKKIKKEKYSPAVLDCINVKHQLDEEDCYITGLCGLKSGRWVVSDRRNSSIKIIKLGSNVTERYICLSHRPFDVTEIGANQTHTDSDSATSLTSSETEENQMGMETLLAVTVPSMHLIMYINLNETPATQVKCISTDGECYGIEFCDGRIYTGMGWLPRCVYIVCILSIDGIVLKRVECMQNSSAIIACRYLAVLSPDKIYIMAAMRDTLFCMDNEGVITSRIKIIGAGISAGNDKNIYVCSRNKHNVYRMDTDLKQCKPVLDKKYSRYMKDPNTLSYFRDRLYVGYHWTKSVIQNFVTVVRLYK